MTKLILRAALAGCATAAVATAQTPPPPPILQPPPAPYTSPAPITVPPPVPVTTFVRVLPAAQSKTVLKAFDVAELVCPPADSPLAKPGSDPAMIAAAKAYTDVRGAEVLKAVRATGNRVGVEMLEFTTDGRTLVVSGSEAVADRVGACVEALRTAHRSHVKVEMTVFTVPCGNEAMVKLFGDKPTAAVNGTEFNVLLRQMKASGAVDILTRPTMVMQNRQTGFCQTGQMLPVTGCPTVCETGGLTSRITPELSTDLKSILLAMEVRQTTPRYGPFGATDSQQTQATVVVPDGGMMAVKVGTRKVERKCEQKVPVVGDLPYIGRLFRTVSSTTEPTDTVAVVTATRLADAPCMVPAAAAPAPTMMPTARPYGTPLAAPVPVMMPLPIRTVGADGLERVGVSFDALTKPTPTPPTPSGVWMATPRGVNLSQLVPEESPIVAGGVIGATVTGDDTTRLMAAYKAACAAGRTDDATRLALQLLAKDPTCFGK